MQHYKLQIAFLVAGMQIDHDTLETRSLGGSETAGLRMAQEMAKRGHRVYLFCNTTKPGVHDNVNFLPAENFPQFVGLTPIDVCIVQRMPEVFGNRIESKLNILWCHDLALARNKQAFRGVMWNVDKVMVLSEFMKKQYQEAYGGEDDQYWLTRNGVDLELFPEPKERNRKALMYCARPERGLDVLLSRIFPAILARDPEIELWIAGYENPVEHMKAFYNQIAQMAFPFGDKVKNLGFLTKKELYDKYSEAGVYVYPTPSPIMPEFNEISCITAMECMAAGLPMVTSDRGALPETLGPAGTFVTGDPSSEGYVGEFANRVLDLVNDESLHKTAGEIGRERAQALSWVDLAEEWEGTIHEEIAAHNDSQARLAAHFIRRNDIVAARLAIASVKDQPLAAQLARKLNLPEGTSDSPMKKVIEETRKKTIPDQIKQWLDVRTEQLQEYNAHVISDLHNQGHPHKYLFEAEIPEGDMVVCVTPFGQHEQDRLWEFDYHDLMDMFGQKKGITVDSVMKAEAIAGQPTGWFISRYFADGKALGHINMSRKLKLQRPQQTISANIMAGPNSEQTLLWTLESIKSVVDEIVIADCGMSTTALSMANGYGAQVFPAVNPIEAGFEAPRNSLLKHNKMDWVLWIDTDEKLVDAWKLVKYLRENCWNGYGIRQYHFACDTSFNPDMPVRLFRNRDYDGQSMRFFGMIHEHPELALNKGPGPIVVLSDVHIAHVGYLVESTRKDRFFRNLPLLERDKQKYPERILQKHFIMRDQMLIVQYQMERNGGQITPEIRELCEKTVKVYQEHFLGKANYVNIDSIQYYSNALRILGKGIDVQMEIRASRDGQGNLNGGETIRFESRDDFLKELEWRGRAAVEPLTTEHW